MIGCIKIAMIKPATTIVLLCSKELTGVGAAIAFNSQLLIGNIADLL